MALVPDTHFMLIAGGNGKLVLMDRSGGKVLANADMASRVDQMAYDPQSHMAYCASGTGKISVVGLEGEKLTAVGDVADAAGCHSIVIDPKTHIVWIAYAKGDQSFAQPFTPGK
jgi:tricorn protease-like protein